MMMMMKKGKEVCRLNGKKLLDCGILWHFH